jgi:glyceraldehyde-3-phosphate dehydrogenase (NADP+)
MLNSDSFPGHERNKLCMVSKVPLGVVLCIPPFNYPVNLAVSKICPALIAGRALQSFRFLLNFGIMTG